MNRILSNLPALVLALALLVASALARAALFVPWAAGAGPLLLVLALVGADAIYRRRLGLSGRPSSSTLLLAATFLVACGIVATGGVKPLAVMIPILGSGVAVSVILRYEGTRTSCRRA
jgi:hypothetical protein